MLEGACEPPLRSYAGFHYKIPSTKATFSTRPKGEFRMPGQLRCGLTGEI